MGTNFYSDGKHIGKRSAAGAYCWDCDITLCKGDNEEIHSSNSEWYTECPICGNKPITENLNESSIGRELGFNKTKPLKKTGVKSCSSFTWACDNNEKLKKIKDEYGTIYSLSKFKKMLKECPVMYYNMIGEDFC